MEQQIKDFRAEIKDWLNETYVELNPYFIENIFEIRKDMPDNIAIPMASMIEYKRAVIFELEMDYRQIKEKKFVFTDDELERNRFASGEFEGRKITKILSELIANTRPNGEQRLDYFHKLRTTNQSFAIYSSPFEMVKRYLEVQTCVSPGGSNQSNIFRYLFSPYTYIIGDSNLSVRMIANIDFEKKYVFLYRIYGQYDLMFAFSTVKYFVENGFTFVRGFSNYFDGEEMFKYFDSSYCSFWEYVEMLNGKILDKEESSDNKVNLFKKPKNIVIKSSGRFKNPDALLDRENYENELVIDASFQDSFGVRYEDCYYCPDCDMEVNADEYDFDQERCCNCANHNHNYCSRCGEYDIADRDFNFELEMCDFCAEWRSNYCEVCECLIKDDSCYNSELKICNECLQKQKDADAEKDAKNAPIDECDECDGFSEQDLINEIDESETEVE